jgi:hypothetical protein
MRGLPTVVLKHTVLPASILSKKTTLTRVGEGLDWTIATTRSTTLMADSFDHPSTRRPLLTSLILTCVARLTSSLLCSLYSSLPYASHRRSEIKRADHDYHMMARATTVCSCQRNCKTRGRYFEICLTLRLSVSPFRIAD